MRRGSSHPSRRARDDSLAPTRTYPAARAKLNEFLKSFSYVKVVEVNQLPAKDGRPAFFHGVGLTQSNSKFGGKSEQVFFDKGSRLRHSSVIEVGPCKLIDAAWGRDHSSANPQVGDILIGVLTDNVKPKSRITKCLRSWSRHGKIIMELSRMVEFGTHMSEIDVRAILRQGESALAATALLRETQAIHCLHLRNASSSTDDFWILVRIILWGNLRPLLVMHSLKTGAKTKVEITDAEKAAMADIKLSCAPLDFITNVSSRFEDPDIFVNFSDQLEDPPAPPQETFDYSYQDAFPAPAPYAYTAPYTAPFAPGGTSPPYQPDAPKSPPYQPALPPQSPPYPYAPQSPQYGSGIPPKTEEYDPTKTEYDPSKTEYDPTKTEYDPTKTEYDPTKTEEYDPMANKPETYSTSPPREAPINVLNVGEAQRKLEAARNIVLSWQPPPYDEKVVLSPDYYERIAKISSPKSSPAPKAVEKPVEKLAEKLPTNKAGWGSLTGSPQKKVRTV
jgi:hypothetical protein